MGRGGSARARGSRDRAGAVPRPRFTPLDLGLYAAVIVAWGFSWIALHYQVGVVAPEISVVWRFLLAAPMMFALAYLRGEAR